MSECGRLASGLGRELHFVRRRGQAHVCRERKVIGRLLGEPGVMNRQVRDQAHGPTENSVERKNRPSRRKAEYRWRNPEHRFENAERGTAAAAPLVEIAEQDGRHARQVEKRVEKRAGLIHPGKTK